MTTIRIKLDRETLFAIAASQLEENGIDLRFLQPHSGSPEKLKIIPADFMGDVLSELEPVDAVFLEFTIGA